MSEQTDLRAALGVAPDPEFELELPPGWARHAPDAATRDRFAAGIRQRMMQAHRPDLYAQAQRLLDDSFEAMRRGDTIAFFAPTDPGDETLWLPASILASVRRAQPDVTLDEAVRHAILEYDAAPLDGQKRIVRFERDALETLQGESLRVLTVVYLTPIPGTRRRRALQLTATINRPVDVDVDDPVVDAQRLLIDACVSTLRWRRPQP
ncbi:hypothetical protein [Agrococcus sp. HG114]|uniref:hypothetical protein n=1 Tax=Agrococcus sp. HG114 TaxID=2969757 RepID=UPI00215ABB84|nr:hypothetical protein [Agrococcus sp. HG114]MCR8672012.1 hypothetical protein [Agrococcus sp. HG114]